MNVEFIKIKLSAVTNKKLPKKSTKPGNESERTHQKLPTSNHLSKEAIMEECFISITLLAQ